jgi:TnpA family transposase
LTAAGRSKRTPLSKRERLKTERDQSAANLDLFFTATDSAALGYVVAQFGKWGMPQYLGPNDPTTTIVSLVLAASYFAAYFIAKKDVKLRPRYVARNRAESLD